MFFRPLGWQWACKVQSFTMLGLSQLDTWWLAEGSHGLAFPNGSAAQAQRCRSMLLDHRHCKSQVLSIITPVLCPATSPNGSCCHSHTAQPPRHGPRRGGPHLLPDKGG